MIPVVDNRQRWCYPLFSKPETKRQVKILHFGWYACGICNECTKSPLCAWMICIATTEPHIYAWNQNSPTASNGIDCLHGLLLVLKIMMVILRWLAWSPMSYGQTEHNVTSLTLKEDVTTNTIDLLVLFLDWI